MTEHRPRRRLTGCVILPLLGLVAVLFFVRVAQTFAERLRPAQIVEAPPPLVEVITAAPEPFDHTVPVAGTLEPWNSVDVFPKVGGKVVQLYVGLGQPVSAGDKLATVEATEWSLQAKQAAAGAEMAAQAAEVAGRSFQRVEQVHDRLGEGALSQQDYDLARVQAEGATTQAEVAALQRDFARQMVNNATMTAPVSGVVSRVNARLGGMVGSEYPAFHVVDTTSLVLRCEVGDLDLPRLSVGQRVNLWTDALSGTISDGKNLGGKNLGGKNLDGKNLDGKNLDGKNLDGTVTAVSPALDAWTRRAPIEITLDNPGGAVVGNLFARGEVVVGHDQAAIVLPLEVVQRDREGALVQVVRDGLVVEVPVTVTGESGPRLAVSGLTAGDAVLVPGPVHLTAGERVRTSPRVEHVAQ